LQFHSNAKVWDATGAVALIIVAFLFLLPCPVRAQDSETLASLGLEELMDVEIVTTSRRAEPLSQVAGAVTVLNEEDIFRSGATSLPEVLRLVPGVHVAQMDTDKWAIGIRGFNGILSNKHLVMIDGRPITSPATAGVDWGNSIPVNMIKRIEVVRGVWAHLWGADSFTGVINIITKTAEETQGGQSVTVAGSTGVEQNLRFGGAMGDIGHFSLYSQVGYTSGNWIDGDDAKASSDWLKKQFGFRMDWENAFTDALSFQGNLSTSSIMDGDSGSPHVFDRRKREDASGYGQFTWNRATGLDAGISLRTSFTREHANVDDLEGGTNIIEVEVQHAMETFGVHRLTWGVGSRYYWDNIRAGEKTSIGQERRYVFMSNAFAQDRITLMPESLYLILGTKFDYFGETPVEIQPTIRLLHTRLNEEYWMAVSRAVRADTRWQRSGTYKTMYNGTMYTVKQPDSLTTEKLMAYEAGYRRRISETLGLDVSLYINDYDELAMLEFDSATNTASLSNSLKGTAYGMETQLRWQVTDQLELRPSISAIYQNLYSLDSNPVGDSMPEEGIIGEVKMQALTKPVENVGLDVLVGYVDAPTERNIPGYLTLEVHSSWRASDRLMFELIGKNLGEATEQYSPLRVGPSLDLRVTWEF